MPFEEATPEERIRVLSRLLASTELAYALARQIKQDVAQIRRWDPGQRLSLVGYHLGACQGDAEVSENRLNGLRQELIELLARTQGHPLPNAPTTLAA